MIKSAKMAGEKMQAANELAVFLPNEAASLRLGAWLAGRLQAGDVVALDGALGAGKTTLARGVIGQLCGVGEVPSPTFSLVQHYAAGDFDICHADLYRLDAPEEAEALGLFEDDRRVVLLEWAERLGAGTAAGAGAGAMLRLVLEENAKGGRWARFAGAWSGRLDGLDDFLAHEKAADDFLQKNKCGTAARVALAGDASGRKYERLVASDAEADAGETDLLFMDWPLVKGDRKNYAAQVKLGQKAGDFVKVADFLNAHGLSAPRCFAADEKQGFMLVEDFGTLSMTHMIATQDARLDIFYHEAVAALAVLAKTPPPALAKYNAAIWQAELNVFLDFYLPFAGQMADEKARADWDGLWQGLFGRAETADLPEALVLRDYHSPNVYFLPTRQAARRVGMIDVQDALCGSPIYDLASLLQDARCDVPQRRAETLLDFYITQTGFDRDTVAMMLAFFGAQRNLRIAGVFARLAKSGREDYVQHVPRVLGYVAQNCQHPALADLRDWLKARGVLA